MMDSSFIPGPFVSSFSGVLYKMIKSLIEICEAELFLFDRGQKQNFSRKSWIDLESGIQGLFNSTFLAWKQALYLVVQCTLGE